MHIHILGICGTFMGGVAQLAVAAGHRVTGCDAHVYPPMSDQLQAAGIELIEGYGLEQLQLGADMYVIGNAISRGNPLLEAILDRGLPYTSGPQWLSEAVLQKKHVLGVAGTHGKTTTASILAWILDYAGLNPGFLIGGVPENFSHSARLTDSCFFVIEADEYDTAFFDKRSKFVHYRPRTVILNNLEFDHADIFENLAAIERQFHHLVRAMPQTAQIVVNAQCEPLSRVLSMGCYSKVVPFDGENGWTIELDGEVRLDGQALGVLEMPLMGRHNQLNTLAAIAAAVQVGVKPEVAIEAMKHFGGVKRRLEVKGCEDGVTVLDDFAHHPTAIRETIAALRQKMEGNARMIAVLEPRSNTMKMGTMKAQLPESLTGADHVVCYAAPTLTWDVAEAMESLGAKVDVLHSIEETVEVAVRNAKPGDYLLVMSNGGFGGIHGKLLEALKARA